MDLSKAEIQPAWDKTPPRPPTPCSVFIKMSFDTTLLLLQETQVQFSWISQFKASLVYRVSSRIAKAVTQRNPVSKQSISQVVVAHAFSPSTQEAETDGFL